MKNTIKQLLRDNHQLFQIAKNTYVYVLIVNAILRNKRGWFDYIKSTISMLKKTQHIHGRPMNLTIEPTNICNLDCPVCETGANKLGREDGNLSFKDFKVMLDKVAKHTNTLLFYYMGEPFLNKDSYRMIRYAKDCGIPFVNSCTNGDAVNPEKLIESGIDEISFQIGGMSQETHEIYRINSNLSRVLRNLEKTVELKRILKRNIEICCGFIVMKHNEHEVEQFEEYMKKIGVDQWNVINPCVRNMEQAVAFLPEDKKYWIYDENSINQGILKINKNKKNRCDWIYYSLVVLVNGDVVPCCRDPKGLYVMGNLLKQNLDNFWNGKEYLDFRKKINNNQSEIMICDLCESYPMSQIK